MMRNRVALLFVFFVTSCRAENCDWPGGAITDFGKYCNNELIIEVSEEDYELKYEVHNKKVELLVQQDMSISTAQHWGLFLDNSGNFWVFSSDIGNCVWEANSKNDSYSKKTFDRPLTKSDVPKELYESVLK